MKTLLIDNYDSYTHILGHYLWKVNGERPITIKNDALSLEEIKQLEFDNVVISPGPGHPAVAKDFGVCGSLLQAYQGTPILGVCLGHQGIGLFAGCRVGLAPRARHGKYSELSIVNDPLFEGLPTTFKVVRYHSLVIEPGSLTERVEVLATAKDDGSIMAIRVKGLPYYGVQFHPESIGTQFGEALLQNFRNITEVHAAQLLTEQAQAGCARSYDVSLDGANTLRVHELDWVDSELAFDALYGGLAYAFWLDSSSAERNGRFSFMGSPDSVMESRGEALKIHIKKESGWSSIQRRGSPFDYIATKLAERKIYASVPFAFTGGLVGYLGYELKRFLGFDVPTQYELDEPDSLLMEVNEFLAFDHLEGKLFACSCSADDTFQRRVRRVLAAARRAPQTTLQFEVAPGVVREFPPDFELHRSREGYEADIRDIQKLIRRGESYETCLTNEARLECAADPLELYRVLRHTNPAPYSAYLATPTFSVLSSSPECFLTLDKHGCLKSEPIKGTRARGNSAQEDRRIEAELGASEKDQSELLMIIDLIRNDLARTCLKGSVDVQDFMRISEYATVLQMSSTIRGRLVPRLSAVDLVKSTFPGGSITGAPKFRTMNIIDSFEARPRGVYTGSIGYFSNDGAMELSIAIRTMVLDKRKQEVKFGFGGAILIDSDPAEEFEETMVKAYPLVRAVCLQRYRQFGGYRIAASSNEAVKDFERQAPVGPHERVG